MFAGISIVKMAMTNFAMWILFITSVVGLTFILERWWYYFKRRTDVHFFMNSLRAKMREGSFWEAYGICQGQKQSPIISVLKEGFLHYRLPPKAVRELMSTSIAREGVKLENHLGILGTICNIAPLIGLFGTITGIMRAFRDIAVTGSGGSSVVAMGVAEALVTTATGILIAVPAVITYNYFVRQVGVINTYMETARDDFLVMLEYYHRGEGNNSKPGTQSPPPSSGEVPPDTEKSEVNP
ncbi:MotA/TolQ/ExbB proton channel family protein [bacterium]|nr:MotA/TolQ/ExbB proton channel family protein [bacterium]